MIGHFLVIKKYIDESTKEKDNYHPFFRFFKDEVGDNCGTIVVFKPHVPIVYIHDPEVVHDLFNKYS